MELKLSDMIVYLIRDGTWHMQSIEGVHNGCYLSQGHQSANASQHLSILASGLYHASME